MRVELIGLTKDPKVTLTAYLLDTSPEMKNALTRPAVLIMPGGGYYNCSDKEGEPIAVSFLAAGYHAFVLRYSVGEQMTFPQVLSDAEAALEYIRDNAEALGVIGDKIAALGFSAGGHLTAMLGTTGRIRPNALILAYPCIFATMSSILAIPVSSCDQYVDENTPPTFLFATAGDGLVTADNSLAFSMQLQRNQIPYELHIFQHGDHGLALANNVTSCGDTNMIKDDAAKWMDLCIIWLNHLFQTLL